jgi:hypothetical protein
MSMNLIFGFGGDFLSFVGGLILALDSILEERNLTHTRAWQRTVASSELTGVVMTRTGVKLKNKEDVELSFVRQSTKRAAIGAVILTIGFASLFVSRWLEYRDQPKPGIAHSVDVRQ